MHKYCDKQGNIKIILITCACLSSVCWQLLIYRVIKSKTALKEEEELKSGKDKTLAQSK